MDTSEVKEQDPCDSCTREYECFGVDKDNCPRCNNEKTTEVNNACKES